MHTVFLSEPPLLTEDENLSVADQHEFEISLLIKFSKQNNNSNFDRLPTCPLCLEKLDPAVTGLH